MSKWVYVRGCCLVEMFGYNNKHIETYINYVLNKVPKVTGSEGPVTLSYSRVNDVVKYMYNAHLNCSKTEVNPFYYVTFYGNLRDRSLNETKHEIESMLNSLSTLLHISEFIDILVYNNKDEYIRYTDNKYYKKQFNSSSTYSLYFNVINK